MRRVIRMTGSEAQDTRVKNRSWGFTLTELVIVVGLLAVLAGAAVIAVSRGLSSVSASACETEMLSISSAYSAYQNENASLPAAISDLTDAGLVNEDKGWFSTTESGLNGVGPCEGFSWDAETGVFYLQAPDLTFDVVAGNFPKPVKGEITETSVEIIWSAPEDDGGLIIEQYLIWMNGSEIGDVDPETLSFEVSGLDEGANYDFIVYACQNSGGLRRCVQSFTLDAPTLPLPPTDVEIEDGSLIVSWSESESEAVDGYNVYFAEINNGSSYLPIGVGNDLPDRWTPPAEPSLRPPVGQWSQPGPVSLRSELTLFDAESHGETRPRGRSNSVRIDRLAGSDDAAWPIRGDQEYIVMVESYNASGSSRPFIQYKETEFKPPSAPLEVTAVPLNRAIEVAWVTPFDTGGMDIEEYRVYVVRKSDGVTLEGSPIEITSSPVTVGIKNGLDIQNGTEYEVRVAAYNLIGEGPYATSDNVTPTTALTLVYEDTMFKRNLSNQQIAPTETNIQGSKTFTCKILPLEIPCSTPGALPTGIIFNSSTGVFTGPASWPLIDAVAGFPFVAEISVSAENGTTDTIETFTLGLVDYAPSSAITGNASSITATSATITGNSVLDPGYPSPQYGIALGTSSSPTQSSGLRSGPISQFAVSLTGLQPNTTYYFRTFASNTSGNVYGEQKILRTLSGSVPQVSTGSARNVTSSSATIASNNVSADGGSPVTTRGVVFSRGLSPLILGEPGVTSVNSGSGTGTYNVVLNSLSPGSNYRLRAFAQNAIGAGYGSGIITFSTLSPATPSVTTAGSSSITNVSATIIGEVTADGGSSVNLRGFFISPENSNPDINQEETLTIEVGSGLGQFTATVGNLSSSQRYYYRAFAQNSVGIGKGSISSFTTLSELISPPSVVTGNAGSIQSTTANILNNEVTDANGATVTSRGVIWSSTRNTPEFNLSGVTAIQSGSSVGVFNTTLSNLPPSSTIFYRAFAQNSAGSGYGSIKQFTTPAAAYQVPTVATGSAGTVSDTSFIVSGNSIPSTGGSAIASKGVRYGTTTSMTANVSAGTGSSSFDVTLSNLTPDTRYYFQAYATNSVGTGVGLRLEQRTLASSSQLPAPNTITASGTRGTVVVSWSEVLGASRYELALEEGNNSGRRVVVRGDLVPSQVCSNNNCAFTMFTNWSGISYRYRVRAVDSAGVAGLERWTASGYSYNAGIYSSRTPCETGTTSNATTGLSLVPSSPSVNSCSFSGSQRVRDVAGSQKLGITTGIETTKIEMSALINPTTFPSSRGTILGVDSGTSRANNMFIAVSSASGANRFGMCVHLVATAGTEPTCAWSSSGMQTNRTYFVRGIWTPGTGIAVDWWDVVNPSTSGTGSILSTSTTAYVNDGSNASGGSDGIWIGSGWSAPAAYSGTSFFRGRIQNAQIFRG